MRKQLLHALGAVQLLRAVVHAEGDADIEQASAMVKPETGIRPVQVWNDWAPIVRKQHLHVPGVVQLL